MKILQAGMAKSGNYWLWNILQEIIDAAALPNQSFIQEHPIHAIAKDWQLSFQKQADIDVIDVESPICYYRISSIFRMPIKDMDAYLSQCNHVWTHSAINAMSDNIFPKFDKIVLIVRDPRDIIVSQIKFNLTQYKQDHFAVTEQSVGEYVDAHLPKLLADWSGYNYAYLAQSKQYPIHVVFYEQLIHDFMGTVANLCAYLGVNLDNDTIQTIHQKTSFHTLKKQDPNHVRQGKAYKWTSQLTTAQQSLAIDRAGGFLAAMGYPQYESELDRIPDASNMDMARLMQSYEQMMQVGFKDRAKSALIRLIKRL